MSKRITDQYVRSDHRNLVKSKGSNILKEMRELANLILYYQNIKDGIASMVDIVGNPITIEDVESKLVEYREKIKNTTV